MPGFPMVGCCVEDEALARIENGGVHDNLEVAETNFASLISDMPGAFQKSVSEKFLGIWNLCSDSRDDSNQELVSSDANAQLRGARNSTSTALVVRKQVRTPDRTRERNASTRKSIGREHFLRGVNQESDVSTSPKKSQQALSAKQVFEMHAGARNACRTPVGLQRVLDEVNQHGGSGETREAQAKFSVNNLVHLVREYKYLSEKQSFVTLWIISYQQELFLTEKRCDDIKQQKNEMYVARRVQDSGESSPDLTGRILDTLHPFPQQHSKSSSRRTSWTRPSASMFLT